MYRNVLLRVSSLQPRLQPQQISSWLMKRGKQTSFVAALHLNRRHYHHNTVILSKFKSYLNMIRNDKPIGTWLLYWPCVWSVCMYSHSDTVSMMMLAGKFAVGAWLMRGAGCIINDLWDRDLDKHVQRTAQRPLACGEVTVREAMGFLSVHLVASMGLLLTFDTNAIVTALGAVPLVIVYPLAKRITYWPQMVLGLTFNWGVWVGWAATAATTSVAWTSVLPLYVSGVAWTIVYDTIYAHQDADDDIKVGVKSTALYFGDRTIPWLCGFGGLSVLSLATAGYLAHMSTPFYVISVAGSAAHYAWQLGTVNLKNGQDCAAKFKSNKFLGAIVAAGILCGAH